MAVGTGADESGAPVPKSSPPSPRVRHFGDYELLEVIARGGMGEVYRARQMSLNRPVALKMILTGQLATPALKQRFHTEAEAAARLDHPNIVPIYELGEHDGQHYFTMKLVEGGTLAERASEFRVAGLKPSAAFSNSELKARYSKLVALITTIARAVHYAHQRGILHRDLKPTNILIDTHGEPHVTDFGLAKLLEDDSSLTMSAAVLGTPAYMSPEQAAGQSRGLTIATDIHALGAILYELLTGQPPFVADTPLEIMRKVVEEEPMRPSAVLSRIRGPAPSLKSRSGIDRDLETICLKCLNKDPQRRFGSAEMLAEDLERWRDGKPITARPVNMAERFCSWCRRKPALATSLSLVLILFLVVLIGSPIAALRISQARNNETRLRLLSDRRAYASDMNLAQRALEMNNIGRALNLLDRHRPTNSSDVDLRGWEWRYLWGQCQSDADSGSYRTVNGVTSLSASHDGAWLALGLVNTGVSIRDRKTQAEIEFLPAGGIVVRVAFSPRELLLAYSDVPNFGSSKTNHSIHIWNGTTRRRERTLSIGYQPYGVAFSEDGKTLVTSTRNPDNQITLWRVSDGQRLASYFAPQAGTAVGTPFAVTRNLDVAAHQTGDDAVRVVDLATGQERWKHKATDDYVEALAFSPDGAILASGEGFSGSTIRLWDVASGRELGRLEGHRAGIEQLLFLPDGRTLASASIDQTIRLWDVSDPANGRPTGVLRGHRGSVRALALLPDNTTLVSGSNDRTVRLWNTTALREERGHVTLPMPVGPWRFTPDSKSLVTLDDNQDYVARVARWHGVDYQEMQPLLVVGTNIHEGCLSGDGRWLAVSWADGDIRVWDLQRRTQAGEFSTHARSVIPREFLSDRLSRISARAVPEQSVDPRAFLEEGKKLMVVHIEDNSLHEWDLTTWRETRSWPSAEGRYTGAISPDGHWYLSSILNPDAGTVTALTDLSGRGARNLNLGWYIAASFSPDGKFFALGNWGSDVRLFETATARELAKLSGVLGEVHGVAFSPDGTRFLTGHGAGGHEAVAIWDMESCEKVLSLAGRGSLFDAVAFSPDGNVLAASNWRGVLHLWRAPSWEEIEAAEQAQNASRRQRSSTRAR